MCTVRIYGASHIPVYQRLHTRTRTVRTNVRQRVSPRVGTCIRGRHSLAHFVSTIPRTVRCPLKRAEALVPGRGTRYSEEGHLENRRKDTVLYITEGETSVRECRRKLRARL